MANGGDMEGASVYIYIHIYLCVYMFVYDLFHLEASHGLLGLKTKAGGWTPKLADLMIRELVEF